MMQMLIIIAMQCLRLARPTWFVIRPAMLAILALDVAKNIAALQARHDAASADLARGRLTSADATLSDTPTTANPTGREPEPWNS